MTGRLSFGTLTTNIETVPATGTMGSNSTITGVISGVNNAAGTFQTGDIINGNGTSNLAVTVAAAVDAANSPLVQINTLGNVTFRTLAAANINAQLFNNVGTVGSNQSSAVLTVNNGALASTYALSNTNSGSVDGLNVGLRAGDITGAANTINFSVARVGTAANTAGGVNAVDSQLTSASAGVEGIAVATAGTNFFSVTGATGAATDSRTLAVTGAGANTIDARGLTQANSFNLSGATGANTLRLDNVLTSSSTVTGGAGADTLRVAPTGGNVIANLSVSAVETLRLGTGSNTGTLLFAAAPNFSTVRIDGDAAEAGTYTLGTVGSFANLNFIGDGATASSNTVQQFNNLTVNGSFTGSSDTVAVRLSNQGVVNAAGLAARTFTANGVETINVAIADTSDAAQSTLSITSNTASAISFAGLGNITTTITAAPATEPGGLASVNLSGMTTAALVSVVNLIAGSTSANTAVTAAVGGTTLNIGGNASTATDVVTFIGGAGNDTVNAANATNGTRGDFQGTLVASLGAGTNAVTTTATALAATTITAAGAGSINTVAVNGTGTVSYIASGTGSQNTITVADNVVGTATAAGSTVAVSLVGTGGVQTFTGGGANDTITGGDGADILTGGAGADRLRYTTAATSVAVNGANTDFITDFTTAVDQIQLFASAGAGGLLGGVTITAATAAFVSRGANVVDATAVANIGAVFAAINVNAAFTDAGAAFAASSANGTGTGVKTISFANGAAAGTYLVVNDAVGGFQAAADLVIGLGTGVRAFAVATDIGVFV